MPWLARTITVPSTPGAVSIVDQDINNNVSVCLTYGTNFLTEDALTTAAGTGLFRGIAAPSVSSPGNIFQMAGSLCPAGDAHRSDLCGVLQIDTLGGAGILYRGTIDFDAHGITVNFDVVAAGGHKVVVLIGYGFVSAGELFSAAGTMDLGFLAQSAVTNTAWGGPVAAGTDRTQEGFGGGSYDPASNLNWQGGWLAAYCFPTSVSAQFWLELMYQTLSTPLVSTGVDFIGPFLLTGYSGGRPVAPTEFAYSTFNPYGAIIWDEISRIGMAAPSAVAGGVVAVPVPFSPAALIGYSIGNHASQQGTGGIGACGFSVVTDDFQWCALVDGSVSGGRAAFQSYAVGCCAAVSTTQKTTADVTLGELAFEMETVDNGLGSVSWMYHAFKGPRGGWIPQVYRRVPDVGWLG